jgi:hypothetical protein
MKLKTIILFALLPLAAWANENDDRWKPTNPTPEPATVGVVGAALLGGVLYARKRRKQ